MSNSIVYDKALHESRLYWRDQLSKVDASAYIPMDYPCATENETAFTIMHRELEVTLCEKLIQLTDGNLFLLYSIQLLALKLTQMQYSGSTNVLTLSPSLAGKQDNLLPIVFSIDIKCSFKETVVTLKNALQEAYRKKHYPLSQIIEELPQHTRPTFYSMAATMSGLHTPLQSCIESINTTLGISFEFQLNTAILNCEISYQPALYRAETISRLYADFVRLLEEGVKSIAQAGTSIEDMFAASKPQPIAGLSSEPEQTLREMFEKQAKASPLAWAVKNGKRKISYRELNQNANRLAHFLKELALDPENPVVLCLENSEAQVVSVLALLKARLTFIVADPKSVERTCTESSGQCLLLSRDHLHERNRIKAALPQLKYCLVVDSSNTAAEPFEQCDFEAIKQSADFIAETCSDQQFAADVRQAIAERAPAIASWLNASDRLLDLGCGNSVQLYQLAQRISHYVGLDCSTVVQQKNESCARSLKIEGLSFRTGFAHHLDEFANSSFDVVLLSDVLESFPGPLYFSFVLQQLSRILVAGGRILLSGVEFPLWQGGGAAAFSDFDAFAQWCKNQGMISSVEQYERTVVLRLVPRKTGTAESDCVLWVPFHWRDKSKRNPRVEVNPPEVLYLNPVEEGNTRFYPVKHRELYHSVRWLMQACDLCATDQFLQEPQTNASRLVSMMSVLTSGGCLDVAKTPQSEQAFARSLLQRGASVWYLSVNFAQRLLPTLISLCNDSPLQGPRVILLQGRNQSQRLARELYRCFPNSEITGLFCHPVLSVAVSYFRFAKQTDTETNLEACPVPGFRHLVAHDSRIPLPKNLPGKLWVENIDAGVNAAALNNGHYRWYGETSKVVRVRDEHCDIRLNEIESALCQHPDIYAAEVIASDNISTSLNTQTPTLILGFLITRNKALTEADIKEYLSEGMGMLFTPEHLMFVDQFPLCADGEVNRLALLEKFRHHHQQQQCEKQKLLGQRENSQLADGSRKKANSNPDTIERIKRIWKQVLQSDAIQADTDFFAIGGNSLKATQVVSRLRDEFKFELSLQEFFQHSTCRKLSKLIQTQKEVPASSSSVPELKPLARQAYLTRVNNDA